MALRQLEDMTEANLKIVMNVMGMAIETAAEITHVEKPHFALVLFNDPAVGQYVANCERADVILALRELADRLERNQDVERVPFPPPAPRRPRRPQGS